jgi:hypothetical protein
MSSRFDPGSFRDPDGRVFHHEGEVFRTVAPERIDELKTLSQSASFQSLVDDGLVLPFSLLSTRDLTGLNQDIFGPTVLKQRKISFVSYPAEWPFEMLRTAALTTLEIIQRSLQAGWILKDATPFNIVFEGRSPRFVDIYSFVPHRPGRPWLSYGQFCRSFLYPLLIESYKKIDPSPWLLAQSAEITPHAARRFFNLGDMKRPGVLKDIWLAAWLDSAATEKKAQALATQSHFPVELIKANVARLTKIISNLPSPYARPSTWTSYADDNSYDAQDTRAKMAVVDQLLAEAKPNRVLDIGANSGVYSHIAASHASGPVISLDSDRCVVNQLYQSVKGEQKIYPVVANLAHPTPATGWGLIERPSILTRAKADFVLALAVIHHLRISANIPFRQILGQLAALAPKGVIEWVEPSDEMSQRLMGLRDCTYPDYSLSVFRDLLGEHYEVTSEEPIKGGKRRLFGVRRKN